MSFGIAHFDLQFDGKIGPVVQCFITTLGGTKKDWGNTSPIGATRRKKLSLFLFSRTPKAILAFKLLWTTFDLHQIGT